MSHRAWVVTAGARRSLHARGTAAHRGGLIRYALYGGTAMLMLLVSLTARADAPPDSAATQTTQPATTASSEEAPTPARIELGTINLTGDVPVPEVIIFTPRITIQEATAETLSERIDEHLEAAAKHR